MVNRQQDKNCSITYLQQSEVDDNMRPDMSNLSSVSILVVATTEAKGSSEYEDHGRKFTQD